MVEKIRQHQKHLQMECISTFFPKKEEKRNQWIQAIRIANFQSSKHSRLCSDHFGIEDYYTQKDGKFCLNNDAIPSVFEAFPNHLKKSLKPKRKPPMDRSEVPTKKPKQFHPLPHLLKVLKKVIFLRQVWKSLLMMRLTQILSKLKG